MSRFYGEIGFGHTQEIRKGVYEEVLTDKKYYGTVQRDAAKWRESENIHKDLSVANTISIVADDYAMTNVFAIRYAFWAGAYWTITDVDVQRPRLVLRLGGKYNGPTT